MSPPPLPFDASRARRQPGSALCFVCGTDNPHGLAVSFFQTVTSLQEQTLTIVPKMLAVLATIILMMPWILGTLREYTANLFQNLAAYGLHG